MKTGRMLVVVLVVAVHGAAPASEVRTRAMGGVEAVVVDDSNAINLFNAGNAAGLALLPKENRVDEQVLIGIASNTDEYPGGDSQTMSNRDFGLISPGGRYQGLQYWVTDNDVVRVSAGMNSLSRTVAVKPETSSDSTYRMTGTTIEAQYARKLTPKLAVGARIRPIIGNLKPPSGAGAAVLGETPQGETYSYTLLDWNAGLGYRVSPDGEPGLVLGLNIMPYNDTPDPEDMLAALGSPAGAGTGTLGAYDLKYEATVSGKKVTSRATTSGMTVGGQLDYSAGLTDIGLLVDITAASVDRKDTSELGERSGTQSRYSRLRYGIHGRQALDMGKGAGVRMALALGGASGRLGNLDYPASEKVLTATDQSPFLLGLGFSYVTGSFAVGLGYSLEGEKNSQKAEASEARAMDTSSADSVIRLGGEYWFTPSWAGRLGVALGSRSRDDNDDSTVKPGEEGNPIENDTALSLGVGYKAANGLLVDAALFIHAFDSDPEPVEYEETRSQVDFLLGGKYVF